MGKMRFSIVMLGICCLPFMHPQFSEAKVVQGDCGKTAQYRYDSEEKTLEISGHGSVTGTISVKKQLGKKYLKIKQLTIGKGITTIQDSSVLKYVEKAANVNLAVSIPEGFQKIPDNMFSHLAVTELKIPGSVTEISSGAFWEQGALEKIAVAADNKKYCSWDGALYSKDRSKLLYFPVNKKVHSYVVPDSVRQIEDLAFHGNEELRQIKLPAGLQQLGAGCFYGCINLEKVNISNLHQLEEIRDYHNESGKEIYVPYESSDFSGEDYQDFLSYQSNNREVGYLAYFNGNYGDEHYHSLEREYFGTFERTSLITFAMPDSLKYMASETFRNCRRLHTFAIGKAYRGQINQTEFSPRSLSLYYLEIQDLKVHPKNKAFSLESNLLYTKDKTILCQTVRDWKYRQETFHIPKEVTRIADGAFYMDGLYQNIVVDGDLEEIGVAAFAGSEIQSFTVHGRIGRLKKGAFLSCERMKVWNCEKGVSSMENNVFLDCRSLERAETGGIFSLMQSVRDRISMRFALFPAWIWAVFS